MAMLFPSSQPLGCSVVPRWSIVAGTWEVLVHECGANHVAAYIFIIALQVTSAVSNETDALCLHISGERR